MTVQLLCGVLNENTLSKKATNNNTGEQNVRKCLLQGITLRVIIFKLILFWKWITFMNEIILQLLQKEMGTGKLILLTVYEIYNGGCSVK